MRAVHADTRMRHSVCYCVARGSGRRAASGAANTTSWKKRNLLDRITDLAQRRAGETGGAPDLLAEA